MRCPCCALSDAVCTLESRIIRASGRVRRRRQCNRCAVRWSTEERLLAGPWPAPPSARNRKAPPAAAPATTAPTCASCGQWNQRWQRCAFDFPEAAAASPFAAECLNYLPAAPTPSACPAPCSTSPHC
jgi:hypothetical protein